MGGRWIIDVVRTAIAGHPLFVAAVLDLETREIIDTEVSADAGSAMMAAFEGVVFALGVPELVVLDHGADGDAVAREAARLGAGVRFTEDALSEVPDADKSYVPATFAAEAAAERARRRQKRTRAHLEASTRPRGD